MVIFFQNVLGTEGIGFKIAMGAFDRTRPPVSSLVNLTLCECLTLY